MDVFLSFQAMNRCLDGWLDDGRACVMTDTLSYRRQ